MGESNWTNAGVKLSTPHCLESSISCEGQTLSIVFTGQKLLDFQKGCGPLFDVHCLVVEATVEVHPDQTVVGFVTDLNFGYGRSAGTRISVLGDFAGSQGGIEFDILRQAEATEDKNIAVHRRFSPQALRYAGNGLCGSGGLVPYRLSLLVTIQRESVDEYGDFFLNEVEVHAILQG